jgi:murein DD-endopeptidase MepM/ murein hydrolase activator NlpD
MKERSKDQAGLLARLGVVLSHITRGFSCIIAPNGTGTTVTFNLPGRVAVFILILLAVLVVGLVFVGMTYTRLALLSVETGRLSSENEALRVENQKINEIESELARLDEVRREIEAWAGLMTEQAQAADPEVFTPVVANLWPRRYTYAIMRPFYVEKPVYPSGMLRPAAGWISRGYHLDGTNGDGHHGIDIAAATGTPVRSALEGRVMAAGWDDIYGNLIVIEHSDSLTTIYGHNEKIWVKEGEHVTKGQVIASVGNTGRSTAPHLHFEILLDDKPVDPQLYVDFTKDKEEKP